MFLEETKTDDLTPGATAAPSAIQIFVASLLLASSNDETHHDSNHYDNNDTTSTSQQQQHRPRVQVTVIVDNAKSDDTIRKQWRHRDLVNNRRLSGSCSTEDDDSRSISSRWSDSCSASCYSTMAGLSVPERNHYSSDEDHMSQLSSTIATVQRQSALDSHSNSRDTLPTYHRSGNESDPQNNENNCNYDDNEDLAFYDDKDTKTNITGTGTSTSTGNTIGMINNNYTNPYLGNMKPLRRRRKPPTSPLEDLPTLEGTFGDNPSQLLSFDLIKTVEQLSVRAALAMSRPELARDRTLEVIDEAMELLPVDKQDKPLQHPAESAAQSQAVTDAMLAVIDRLSVRAALTLTDFDTCHSGPDSSATERE